MIPHDPYILLGFINTKLRDQYRDLEALCEDLECDRESIVEKLETIEYRYSEKKNQFH